eukprot:6334623-Pyramimonas_sp.AAC.1
MKRPELWVQAWRPSDLGSNPPGWQCGVEGGDEGDLSREPEIFESTHGDPRIEDPRRPKMLGTKISDPRSEDGRSSLLDGGPSA